MHRCSGAGFGYTTAAVSSVGVAAKCCKEGASEDFASHQEVDCVCAGCDARLMDMDGISQTTHDTGMELHSMVRIKSTRDAAQPYPGRIGNA